LADEPIAGAAVADDSRENKRGEPIDAEIPTAAVLKRNEDLMHEAPVPAVVTADEQAASGTAKAGSASTARGNQGQKDRVAGWERRIAKLEEIVSKYQNGADADAHVGDESSVQLKPEAGQDPQPQRISVVEAQIIRATNMDEPVEKGQSLAAQANAGAAMTTPGENMFMMKSASEEKSDLAPSDVHAATAPAEAQAVPNSTADKSIVPDDQVARSVPIHVRPPKHSPATIARGDCQECAAVFAKKKMTADLQPVEKPSALAPVTDERTHKAFCEKRVNEAAVVPKHQENPREAVMTTEITSGADVSAGTTQILDESSKETPDGIGPVENEVVEDMLAGPAEKPEARVEPPVDQERQAEKIAEWIWRGETDVQTGWQAVGPASQSPRPRQKVLVIDDDPTMRMLLKMGLGSHDYDCLEAEHGKAAQALLQTHRPDLILVDLLMPVMDGLAFLHWLRQTAQDSTPVVALTNMNTPEITQEALSIGANAFVRKPLHLNELLEVMNQLLPR
jgi:CheY-like chemotaxis protein